MNCSEVENKLDEYLDNLPGEGLDNAEAAAIALHIQSCPECAELLAGRQALRQELEAMTAEPPDADFLTRAVAHAAAANEAGHGGVTSPSRGRFGSALMAIAAALVAAVLVGTVLTQPDVPAPETNLQAFTSTPIR